MDRPLVLILGYEPCEMSNHKIDYGGAKKYVHLLISDLLADGFRVAYCVNNHPYVGDSCDEVARLGADIHLYEFVKDDPSRVAHQIDCILGARQPNIVHENCYSALRPAMLRSKAFCHGPWKRICTMHAPLQSAASSGRVRWRHRLPLRWYWQARRADRRFVRLFDTLISVSQVHADALRHELRLPAERLVTIPNGVDTVRFCPGRSREDDDHVVVGGAGHLVSVKRFDILIDAVATVSRSLPINLRIAGSGPEDLALRQRVADRGIADLVEFTGAQHDMPTFLRSLDVFAMTSDSEGLSYALLEAMATGLPSVVTNVGDLPVVVRNHTDGYVVPREATELVAKRLSQLVMSSDVRKIMGQNARQRVCDTYSQSRASQDTLAVFRDVLS